jgi:fido (protein-threonine AMPylation protein)
MGSPNFVDPYLIPGTAVLRNLVGAKTPEELAVAEADLSFVRATQLLDEPVPATNDLAELKAIHFHLFQDLFEWAGRTRTVDVRKNVPDAEFFLPWGFIETASINCFQELASERHLKELARTEFVERLALPAHGRNVDRARTPTPLHQPHGQRLTNALQALLQLPLRSISVTRAVNGKRVCDEQLRGQR